MHFTSRTFKLWREPPKQKRSVILLTRCHTRKYEHFTTHIVSQSRTKGILLQNYDKNLSSEDFQVFFVILGSYQQGNEM